MNFDWMAWTWTTTAFFGFIALCLIVMTTLAVRYPETPRRGILGFPTTRGDRLFVSLVGTAFLFILFIRLGGDNLWWPLAAGVVYWGLMFRYA